MTYNSDVKQSIALTADGLFEKYIGTSAVDITNCRIKGIVVHTSAADATVKLYDEAGSSKTASALKYSILFGTAANETWEHTFPGDGIKCENGVYCDLTNADHVTIMFS
jgi:hypothetical protein